MRPIDPTRVGTAELAHFLGLSGERIRTLKHEGVLTETARGKYDLAASVQSYVKWVGGGRARKHTENRRDDLIEEQRRRLQIENDHKEGRLVDLDFVGGVIDEAMILIRTQLDGQPGRMAGELASISDPAVIRQKLQHENRRILAAAAEKVAALGASGADRAEPDPAADEDAGPVG